MARAKKTTAKKPASKPSGVRLYTLEVLLESGRITEEFFRKNPVVSRTIQIRGDQTLEDLHFAIFDAFNRFEEHMYEFHMGKSRRDRKAPRYVMGEFSDEIGFDDLTAGTVEETTIGELELRPRKIFTYWFDFGDDWWHRITVKSITDAPASGKFPKVISRVGKSPPQYPDDDE